MKIHVEKSCYAFVRMLLKKESWFRQMTDKKDYDLLLLTGTKAEEASDKLSDIDIFLVCKKKTQVKYHLKPVYTYDFKGKLFELSVVSTEKLYNDQFNKRNIHWWYYASVLISFSSNVQKAFRRASTLTNDELLDRLWTNFVYFKINTFDIKKQIQRNEIISVRLLFNENIKLVMDSLLIHNGKFPSWKQFGRALKQIDSDLYDSILNLQEADNFQELCSNNEKLEEYFLEILKKHNFSEQELEHWEGCNLTRITFQYS